MVKQFKTARRLGARIFPKTENPKFVLNVKQRGGKRRRQPLSEFGTQLFEKQKARYFYGIRERQFANYVKQASAKRGVNPAAELFRLLESRLDNVIFRFGFAKTRLFARQMVSHGHILVNGRKVTIPSYSVRKGDVVAIRPESKDKALFSDLSERQKEHTPPVWLSRDDKKLEGSVRAEPTLDKQDELLFNLTSVIEFYSR